MILSVDPGLRKCGCALFVDGRLFAAGLVLGELEASMDHARTRGVVLRTMAEEVHGWALAKAYGVPIQHLAIEMPMVRDRRSQRAEKAGTDPKDIVHLAAIVGAIVAAVPAPSTVWLPEEWKGQVPKPIHTARTLAKLTPEELARVPKRPRAHDIDHNILDGIGIGLHYLGRD